MNSTQYQAIYDEYGIDYAVDVSQYNNLLDVYNQLFIKHASATALTCMGYSLSYKELDEKSNDFAAYLQNETNLVAGDRVAVMLPNILQQPVSVLGILKAGMVLVNTNPLYTPRELEHQLNDSGAKALVMLANMGDVVEEVLPHTQNIEHVLMTQVGDFHPTVKRLLINTVVKYVKKGVPKFNLPQAISLNSAIALGSQKQVTQSSPTRDDVAVLQYTGGTTGLSKGAMLTHGNLIANCLQLDGFLAKFDLKQRQEVVIQPLPLYHIYAFTMTLVMLRYGSQNVLIPNPRDLPGLVTTISKYPASIFCGLNTLFVALFNDEKFKALPLSELRMTVSGGMALTQDTAKQWKRVTGVTITEGYGLTEASPVVTFNPAEAQRIGSIGFPLPLTDLKLLDDNGNEVEQGSEGELAVKGPQVMKGYWNNEEATAKTIVDDWLLTGDIATIGDDGFVKIVDRKKDMIIVSGFNVYPNEVEDELSKHPEVVECAVIGIPDDIKGENIKAFVVKTPNSTLTDSQLIEFARENLTAYKVPKLVEFRSDLPKSNVGKILRRELRDE
ncbi:MAG: AMP-binding protein [Pseudomonadota bacterium]